MKEENISRLCCRIRLECGYIVGRGPVALHITLRCDEGGSADMDIEEVEAVDRAEADDDIVVEIAEALPAMQSLLREERRFVRAIAASLLRNVSIEELADACCLSVSTFKRRFRARYSASPHHWLLMQRLKIAHELILATTLTISDLAVVCGFPSVSHFIAQFRRRYSTTPMQLRDRSSFARDSDGEITIDIEL